ncbi:hypothetical protein D5F01_LYC22126 [Larimichthys crocea]|uniref:Uncharacterized protein n=1 Tax=Larimichthys crocea TaxID=215358 RepID=A0A6G0HLT0_LARCR|nr:hypothetical protein D5F01_LYC22126 [Larimichthys crocea]
MSRKRKEKRQIELCVLELFSREGQRVLKERERASETIGENTETVEKLLAEINTPFSHQSSLLLPPSDKNPPPYEKKAESKSVTIYPQIPVLSQDGTYTVEDDERRVIEEGKATTTIVMRPYTKSKKPVKIEKKAKERGLRKTTLKKYDYDSDDDTRTIGGYDPSVKKILARAERRGRKSLGKAGAKGADTSDSDNGDGDSDWECTPVRRNLAEEEGWQSQKDWEERCRRVSFAAAGGKLTSDPEPEFVGSHPHGEEEAEETLEEETSIQAFNSPQEHVIIVESWDIMRVIVSSQAEVFPEEVSEEDLDGNNIRPGDQ